jgi:hypothetical protein
MVGDEGQQSTIALRGGLDRDRRQLSASRVHDARAVTIGVGVYSDDGVGLGGVTMRRICDGSRATARTGF